jgi:hypothetical protein
MALSLNNPAIIKKLLIYRWIKFEDIVRNDSLEWQKTIKILGEDASLFCNLSPFEATDVLGIALDRAPNIASILLQNPTIRSALVLRHGANYGMATFPYPHDVPSRSMFDKAINEGHIDLIQDLLSVYCPINSGCCFAGSLMRRIFSDKKLSPQTLSSLLQMAADLPTKYPFHTRSQQENHKELFDKISSCIVSNELTLNLLIALQQSENCDHYLTPDALTLLNEKRKCSTQTMPDNTSPTGPAVVMHYNALCETTQSHSQQKTSNFVCKSG